MSLLGLADYNSSDEEEAPVAGSKPSVKERRSLFPHEISWTCTNCSRLPLMMTDQSILHKQHAHIRSPSLWPEVFISSPSARAFQLTKVQDITASAQASEAQQPSLPRDTSPVQGPTAARPPQSPPSNFIDSTDQSPAQSPYTAERSLIHSLTLPPVPMLSIPPSPPGSPRHTSAKKISHFLTLKSQGVHFNAKLAQSRALRNPGLLESLSKFAGLDENDGQYATTLPAGTGPVPEDGFPTWAYFESLNRLQEEVGTTKRKTRTEVDFVSATGKQKGGEGVAEQVRAGANGTNRASPQVSAPSHEDAKRVEGDQRRSRFDQDRNRRRSRSPRRR